MFEAPRPSPISPGRKAVRAVWWLLRALFFTAVVLVFAIAMWLLAAQLRIQQEETVQRDKGAPAGRWIDVKDAQGQEDARLHVQEWGRPSNPLLLLVHGTGAWSGTWTSNVDAMAQAGFHVVALDLPPFGFSERPVNSDYSRTAQARRILAVIDYYGPSRAVLLGHSFGGGPAAEAAMLAPHRLRHLILVDAAIGLREAGAAPCVPPPENVQAVLGRREVRTLLVAATATHPWLTGFWLRQFVTRDEAVTPTRSTIYSAPFSLRDFSGGLGDWAWQFATGCEAAASATVAGWRNLQVSTTMLWGDHDDITPPAQARRLAELMPRSRLVMLPGVGHIPQIEDVERFNAAIGKVLAGGPP